FFHRLDRVVRRDCTFLLHNRFYEAPADLGGETIEVRFDPLDPATVEIYFQGQPQGTARLVDPVINAQRPSSKPSRRHLPSPPASTSWNCSKRKKMRRSKRLWSKPSSVLRKVPLACTSHKRSRKPHNGASEDDCGSFVNVGRIWPHAHC